MAYPISYTIPDAVKASGISRTRLYALMGDGSIPAVKLGKRVLIPAAQLAAYVASLPPATIRPQRKAA